MIVVAPKDMSGMERYLRECPMDEVKTVMQDCAEKRLEQNRGYSKNKNIRMLSDIPHSIYFHPRLRHIFHNPDPIEGAKLKKRFLETFSKFKCVDKL